MKKMKNKSINLSLKMLTILAFVMIFVPFNSALAFDCFHPFDELFPSNTPTYYQPTPTYYYQPAPAVYIAPQPPVTPVIYSNTVNPNPVMTVSYVPTVRTVAKAKTTPKTVATNTTPGNALAANAVFGSNSFLPTGIIQWVLVGIAILGIVILSRVVFGAKKSYQESPLKHE